MTATLKKTPRSKIIPPKPVLRQRPTSDEEPQPFKWTGAEYHRLGDEGFFRGQRVQLIEGSIIEMSPQKHPHTASIDLTFWAIESVFGVGWWVRNQAPLKLSEISEPEPDVAVVRGGPREWTDHPTTAELVIEVSDTTLRFDLGGKAATYAKALIPEYWVVDLVHRQLIVHRQPKRPRSGAARFDEVAVYEADAVVKPLAKPKVSVKVADLLP
jgi:Uma2 family endonuclease